MKKPQQWTGQHGIKERAAINSRHRPHRAGDQMKTVRQQICVRLKERLVANDHVFFPDSFGDICSTETALEALKELAAEGELETRAQIYSPDGHICFDDEIEHLSTVVTHDARGQQLVLAPAPCCGRELKLEDATLYFIVSEYELHPKAAEYIRPREALERILELSDRKELREIYAIAAEALAEKMGSGVPPGTCTRPPPGWYCTRAEGHEGPCPSWPQ